MSRDRHLAGIWTGGENKINTRIANHVWYAKFHYYNMANRTCCRCRCRIVLYAYAMCRSREAICYIARAWDTTPPPGDAYCSIAIIGRYASNIEIAVLCVALIYDSFSKLLSFFPAAHQFLLLCSCYNNIILSSTDWIVVWIFANAIDVWTPLGTSTYLLLLLH